MALFLQSLLLEGSRFAVIVGGAVAVGFLVLIGALTFRFGVKLPYRKLMVLTGALVVSIMVTFIGSTVRLSRPLTGCRFIRFIRFICPTGRALARALSELGGFAHPAAGAGLCRRRVVVQPLAFTQSGK